MPKIAAFGIVLVATNQAKVGIREYGQFATVRLRRADDDGFTHGDVLF